MVFGKGSIDSIAENGIHEIPSLLLYRMQLPGITIFVFAEVKAYISLESAHDMGKNCRNREKSRDPGSFFQKIKLNPIVSCFFSVCILWFLWKKVGPIPFNYDYYYPRIANNPFLGEEIPYSCRILSGILVYLSPFSIETGFMILNLGSIFASSLFLLLICRTLGISRGLSFWAPVPYLLSIGVYDQLSSIWLADPLNQLLLSGCIWAFLKNRDDWMAIGLLIGVLNRETILFFFPAWYLVRFGWKVHYPALKQTCLYWGPSLIALLALKYIWFPLTFYYHTNFKIGHLQTDFFSYYWNEFHTLYPSWKTLVHRIVSLSTADLFVGTLLPIFGLGILQNPGWYRRLSIFVLIGWLQLLLVHGSGARLIVLVYPVLIPLALLVLDRALSGCSPRWIYETVVGLLLLILPHSFLAGIIFVAPVYWMQRRISSRICEAPLNPTGLNFHGGAWKGVSLSGGRIVLLATGGVLACLSVFCWITDSVRPSIYQCFPPSLVTSKRPEYDCVFLLEERAETVKVSPDILSPDSWLFLDSSSNSQGVIFPIPDEDKPSIMDIQVCSLGEKSGSFEMLLIRNDAYVGQYTFNHTPRLTSNYGLCRPSEFDAIHFLLDDPAPRNVEIQIVFYDFEKIHRLTKMAERINLYILNNIPCD